MIYSPEQYYADLNGLGRFANDAVYWSRCIFDKKSRRQVIKAIEILASHKWLNHPSDTDLNNASELRMEIMDGLIIRAMKYWFDCGNGPILLRPKYLDKGAYRLYMPYGSKHFMLWVVNPEFVSNDIKSDLNNNIFHFIESVVRDGFYSDTARCSIVPKYKWLDTLYLAVESGVPENLIFRDKRVYENSPGVECGK